MKSKKCIQCEKPSDIGRRFCHDCYLERRREFYRKNGRWYCKKQCEICHQEFKAWKKTQRFCTNCYKNKVRYVKDPATNNYVYNSNGNLEHRVIAEKVLNRKLNTDEVVHHLDGNPKNNNLTNLIVISRQKHGQLHYFLHCQRALLEQSNNEQSVNCWKALRVSMTTTWLETASVKVKKLWEIG